MSTPALQLVDGDAWIISPSQLNTIKTCACFYKYNYLHGREANRLEAPLVAGKAFDAAMNLRYSQCGSDPVTDEVVTAQHCLIDAGFAGIELPQDEYRTPALFKQALDRYNEAWEHEPWTVLGVQMPVYAELGSIEMPDAFWQRQHAGCVHDDVPHHMGSDNDTTLFRCRKCGGTRWGSYAGNLRSYDEKRVRIVLRGFLDKLVRNTHGHVMVVDTKTMNSYTDRTIVQWQNASQPKAYCYRGDTEVLTPDGWVRLDALKKGKPVMQWSPEGARFVVPSRYIKQQFTGNLLGYKNRGIDFLTTPEHRHLLHTSNGFESCMATNIPQRYPRSAFVTGGQKLGGFALYSGAFLRYLVALQADGCYQGKGGARFHFKKQRKIERMTALLHELGWTGKPSKLKCGTAFGVSMNELWQQEAYRLLTREKVWGSWVLGLDAASMRIIVDELRYWDGTDYTAKNKGFMYFSIIASNAVWMQTLGHLCGYRVSLHVQDGLYRLLFTTEVELTTRSLSRYMTAHDGEVYCLTVPSSWLFVRHNGKIAVSGNCWAVTEMSRLHPELGLPAQVHGFILNAVVIRKPYTEGRATPRNALPRFEFHRPSTFYSPQRLEEWRQDTLRWAETALHWVMDDQFPMNDTQCGNHYGRACPYLTVCETDAAQREDVLGSDLYRDYKRLPLTAADSEAATINHSETINE